MTQVAHLKLGRMPYGPVLSLQRGLRELRRQGRIPDLLITLEHEPVITLGRDASEDHLLLPREELKELGVEVVPVERGGAATYHGPGQLVMYPIVHLRDRGLPLRRYVQLLEEVMIRTAWEFGVEAGRRPGFPGVWVGPNKLGFLGVHVQGWVTIHGLALNVDLNPNGFAWIVPCGLPQVTTVSLAELSRSPPGLEEVREAAVRAFAESFGAEVLEEEVPKCLWKNLIGLD